MDSLVNSLLCSLPCDHHDVSELQIGSPAVLLHSLGLAHYTYVENGSKSKSGVNLKEKASIVPVHVSNAFGLSLLTT